MLNCPAKKSFKWLLLAFLVSYAGQSANVLAYVNQQPYDVEHISVMPQSFSGENATLLGGIDALLLVPQGFEQGFRQPAVAASAAGTVFGSSLVGTAAAGATTGAVSFGAGGATGEALIGGSLKNIAIAGGKDAALGAVTFGVFGGGARLLAGENAAVESFDAALLRSQASQLSEAGPFVRFIR